MVGLSLGSPASDFCIESGSKQSFTTYVVDDNVKIRTSVSFMMDSFGLPHALFESGEVFLDSLVDLLPGPVLLDIRMSGIDGIGVLTALAERGVRWPVIIMTGHGDVALAVTTMKMGAIEFLEKPFNPETLVDSLVRAFDILADVTHVEAEQAAARTRLATLTPRESDVVHSLIDGAANKIVAYRLNLSPRTVEMHRANAFAKLGLRNIADLIRMVRAADLKASVCAVEHVAGPLRRGPDGRPRMSSVERVPLP